MTRQDKSGKQELGSVESYIHVPVRTKQQNIKLKKKQQNKQIPQTQYIPELKLTHKHRI